MTDRALEGLIESLGADFDAAIARAEDVAASDLAQSLRQDQSLSDVVARGGWMAELGPEERVPLEVLGRDHFVTREARPRLVPFEQPVLVLEGGIGAPRDDPRSLVEVMREHLRRGGEVQVSLSDGTSRTGFLQACTPDHLRIQTGNQTRAIPWPAVRWIRLGLGD